jgi:ABC-type uncharacterized transport system ATPase subunit
MICGVLTPDSGSIQIGRLGALLDHTGIYSRLTVRENLTYFGRLQGMPRKQLNERVDEVISTLAKTCGASWRQSTAITSETLGVDQCAQLAFKRKRPTARFVTVCLLNRSYYLDKEDFDDSNIQ